MSSGEREERKEEQPRERHPLLRPSADNPLMLAILLAIFVMTIVAALKVGGSPARQELGDADIGEITRRPLIASHDFTFEQQDDERLRRAQEEAQRRVQPVWDHDPALREQAVDRVARAFQGMRRELRLAAQEQALVRDLEAAPSPRDPPESERDGESDASPPGIEILDTATRIAVASAPAALEEFIRQLQRGLDQPALEALAADGFSEETEHLLRRLVLVTMERRIVPDRQVLQAESEQGITLRTLLRNGEVQERPIRDFDAFLDASDIGDFIDRQLSLERTRVDDDALLQALRAVARALVTVNTVYNERETRSRREAAIDAVTAGRRVQSFRRGQVILDAGRVIDGETVAILHQMNASRSAGPSRFWSALSLAVLVLLITVPLIAFSLRELYSFSKKLRDLLMMGSLLILHLLVTRATNFLASAVVDQGAQLPLEAFFVLAPFATGAMLVRILTTAENSLAYALIYALLTGIIFEFDLSYVTYAFVAGITGSAAVGSSQSRGDVLRAGLVVGVLMALIAIALGLYQGTLGPEAIGAVALLALLSGVLSALLVFALTPLVEGVFSYTTSFRLLELANLNHPALRELVLHAPGSYHHSMMVGQLVEAGCEAVGANALLGRVGAYFHDIGKGRNPKYFAENQQGDNPHDRLSPHMSALVIKAHVKDGVELARQHKLPTELINFIREHHGTSRIEFFYNRACKESDSVDEHDFRYPGPKPQSRETAICLLADQIEAAARAMPDKSDPFIGGLVNRIIKTSFADGQLDACDLTLKDLDRVASAFIKRLRAIYHHRPEYPGADRVRGAEGTRTGPVPAAEAPPSDRNPAPTPAGAESRSKDEPGDSDRVAPPEGPDDRDVAPESEGPTLRRLGLSADSGGDDRSGG